MKVYLQVFLYFIIIIKSFSQEKNYIAEYKLIYKQINFDSISERKNNKNPDFQKYYKLLINNLKNSSKYLKNIKYTLEFNNGASIFKLKPFLEADGSKGTLLKSMLGIKEESYYTNKKFIINEKNSYGEDFLVETPKLNWKISNKQKKIGQFLCYEARATIQRENSRKKFKEIITAWFTPEIPYNYGPKYFSGLPGLIVSLEESKYITIQLEKLSEKKYSNIKNPTKGKKITQKEFIALSKKMYENRGN